MHEFPLLTPLVLTLKQFLYQFNLHETYTGGVGSYALTLMVISLLQLRSASNRGSFEQALKGKCSFTSSDDLGLALIDFFELYGKLLDYRYGISVRGKGSYFDKRLRDDNPNDLLCIEDPADITNDVGRNSFNISPIRSVFHNAFVRLTCEELDIKRLYPNNNFPTLLSRVIQLDKEVVERRGLAWKVVGKLMHSANLDSSAKKNNTKEITNPNSNNNSKRKWQF
jgi:DNA polymerase sigma